jgi:hypothetical protein
MQTALMNVRFEGNNGHDPNVTRCLLDMPRATTPVKAGANHEVGA